MQSCTLTVARGHQKLHTCAAVVYANWPIRSSSTLVTTTHVLAMPHYHGCCVSALTPTRTVFLCLHEQKKGMCENWIKVWPGAHKRVSNFAFIIVCYLTLSHLYYSKSHTLVAVGFNLWVGLAHVILQPRGGYYEIWICMSVCVTCPADHNNLYLSDSECDGWFPGPSALKRRNRL